MHQFSGTSYGNINFSNGVSGSHFNHRYGVPLVGNGPGVGSLMGPSRRTSSVEIGMNGASKISTNGVTTGLRNGRPQFYIVGRTVNSEPTKK